MEEFVQPVQQNAEMNEHISELSDRELLGLCDWYGREALRWKWKFAGLLPEVSRRELWRDAGFMGIFHFAKVKAGMTEESVRRVLNIHKKFENAPKLRSLLENGEVSPNKLAKIASLVSEENDVELALDVQLLSKASLEQLAKDARMLQMGVPGNRDTKEISDMSRNQNSLDLSPEVIARLSELKRKGHDINRLLTDLLDSRDEQIAQTKKILGETEHLKTAQGKTTRHIPARVRRILKEEHGTKCSVTGCNKPAVQIHHAIPFALSPNHDPDILKPFCGEHHDIVGALHVKMFAIRNVIQTAARQPRDST